MADLAAAVADTHALLLHAAGTLKFGTRAAAHFSRAEMLQALVYVPAPVIWETTLLARAGRVSMRRSVREFFDDLFSNPCFQPVDLTPAQIFDADELRFTKDPFDALICATARSLELPLITRDAAIEQAKVVKTIW